MAIVLSQMARQLSTSNSEVYIMATQTAQAVAKATGRNRGLRTGHDQIPPGVQGMQTRGDLKDQTPAVPIIPQDASFKPGKLERKLVDKACALVHGFRPANAELVTLKQQMEAKRGGLSDILFKLAQLAHTAADKPAHMAGYFVALCETAERYEVSSYQKANKLSDTPSVRVAIGASWQTYKSQIGRCMLAGIDPSKFANGTAYRTAKTPSADPRRAPRTTKGTQAQPEVDTKGMHEALSTALAQLIAACKAAAQLDSDEQTEYATAVHKLATRIEKENADIGGGGAGEEEEEEDATATM